MYLIYYMNDNDDDLTEHACIILMREKKKIELEVCKICNTFHCNFIYAVVGTIAHSLSCQIKIGIQNVPVNVNVFCIVRSLYLMC